MNEKCPICCEDLDLTDLSFKPCKCGYQVCLWCYKDINEKLNGRCPACRAPYKGQGEHTAPDPVKLQKEIRKSQAKQKKKEKRTRSSGGGAGTTDRKSLSTMRVLQRNLVYVVGLTVRVAKEEILRKKQYLGKYGKLLKIVVNKKVLGNGATSYCAYVTFKNAKDAEVAIKKINGCLIDGARIKATYGTTKYCTNFLKGITCTNPSCLYLHHLARSEDCFSKEDLSNVDTFNYQELLELSRQASITNATSRPQAATSPPKKAEAPTTTPKLGMQVKRVKSSSLERQPRSLPATPAKEISAWDSGPKKAASIQHVMKPRASSAVSLKEISNSDEKSPVMNVQDVPSPAIAEASEVAGALDHSGKIHGKDQSDDRPPGLDVDTPAPPGLLGIEGSGGSKFLAQLSGSSKASSGGSDTFSFGAQLSSSLFQQPIANNRVERDVWNKADSWITNKQANKNGNSLGSQSRSQVIVEPIGQPIGQPFGQSITSEPMGQPIGPSAKIGPSRTTSQFSTDVAPIAEGNEGEQKSMEDLLPRNRPNRDIPSDTSAGFKKWDFNKFMKEVLPAGDLGSGFPHFNTSQKRSGSRYSFADSADPSRDKLIDLGVPPGFVGTSDSSTNASFSKLRSLPNSRPESWISDLRAMLPGVNVRYSGGGRYPAERNGEQTTEKQKQNSMQSLQSFPLGGFSNAGVFPNPGSASLFSDRKGFRDSKAIFQRNEAQSQLLSNGIHIQRPSPAQSDPRASQGYSQPMYKRSNIQKHPIDYIQQPQGSQGAHQYYSKGSPPGFSVWESNPNAAQQPRQNQHQNQHQNQYQNQHYPLPPGLFPTSNRIPDQSRFFSPHQMFDRKGQGDPFANRRGNNEIVLDGSRISGQR